MRAAWDEHQSEQQHSQSSSSDGDVVFQAVKSATRQLHQEGPPMPHSQRPLDDSSSGLDMAIPAPAAQASVTPALPTSSFGMTARTGQSLLGTDHSPEQGTIARWMADAWAGIGMRSLPSSAFAAEVQAAQQGRDAGGSSAGEIDIGGIDYQDIDYQEYDEDALPSVGSRKHITKDCTPCAEWNNGVGLCQAGYDCRDCHIHHGVKATGRRRPGKARRDSCKRLVQSLTSDEQALELHRKLQASSGTCTNGQAYLSTLIKDRLEPAHGGSKPLKPGPLQRHQQEAMEAAAAAVFSSGAASSSGLAPSGGAGSSDPAGSPAPQRDRSHLLAL
eukprot:TRINITY_DN46481_c0_g1_i1.p1 TRINITY_DN46481_c0_g1~~TRINITY_DN46481_c0_g1_i1.p1  ORF type:complete len:331 (+),score=52.96 TRINITY_DN46481_c0_g1_i1:136-1128(+)